MALSAAERETNITWSDADSGLATIYTCQAPMIRKLEKNPSARLIETHYDEDGRETGREYEFPVALITLRSAKRKGVRQLSEAHKQALQAGRKRNQSKAA